MQKWLKKEKELRGKGIADYLDTSIDRLLLVASTAEHVVEKVSAIYNGRYSPR
jgi:hypothetical protein